MSKKAAMKVKNKRPSSSTKVWGTKQVLSSPFAAQMPSAIPGSLDCVILSLKRLFPVPPLARGPSRKKPEGLVIGLNQVSKCLERDELRLVVVARDVMPVLVSHIPVLCFLKETILVVVANSGVEIGVLLGSNRALAFGILKEDNDKMAKMGIRVKHNMAKLTDEISSYAVHLSYPWLLPQSKRKEEDGIPKLQEMTMKPHLSIRKSEAKRRQNTPTSNQISESTKLKPHAARKRKR